MLYELFSYLKNTDLPGKDLGNFLSFRAGAAIILSLLITIFFGKYVIRILRRKQIGEDIRDLGLEVFSLFSPLNFLTELSSFYYSLYP